MNKIYKTVWNALRHSLVVVNEATKSLGGQSSGSGRQQGSICAQTPARHGIQSKKCLASQFSVLTLLVLSALSANATEDLSLTGHDKDYVYGDLTDFSLIVADRVHSFKSGAINAPNGVLAFLMGKRDEFTEPSPEEDPDFSYYDYNFGEIYVAPRFEINGNTELQAFGGWGLGVFRGNVNISGTVTREQIEEFITPGTYSALLPGTFFSGGSYHLGGIVVEGDLTASLVQVAAHQAAFIPEEYVQNGRDVSGLIVKGNLEADWLIADIATPTSTEYDNHTDYVEIHGNAHIKQDVYSGGQILVKGKLTVDGTLYNAFGTYVYHPVLGKEEIFEEGLQPPDYVSTTVGELDAHNIQNASNLFVGTLTNDREQVYTQTYGTIRVTDNWFRDSVINMSGGYIDEASLGPDKNLGIGNTFNVTGGTLIVGDLNFDSTVNLSQDGKIQTDIESIFINPDGDPEALNYVGLNASEPESVKASLTKWFTNYVAGTLRTDLEDHVNFNGGSIVVSGFGKITETQYDDLMEAFKEALSNLIGGNF